MTIRVESLVLLSRAWFFTFKAGAMKKVVTVLISIPTAGLRTLLWSGLPAGRAGVGDGAHWPLPCVPHRASTESCLLVKDFKCLRMKENILTENTPSF